MKNKEYGYTLFLKNGEKERKSVAARSEELAIHTVTSEADTRSDVDFFTFDSLDLPCDYDWDRNLEKWQARIF